MSPPAPSPTSSRVLTLPPASGRAEYLMVFLHGVGASADSFLPVARALAPAVPGAEVLVPEGFHSFDGGPTGRQWYSIRGVTPENRAARVRVAGTEVSAWLDRALAARGLGGARLIVVGFSQGAMLANWLALHRTPAPAAVISLSGRLVEDAPPEASRTTAPVLLVHGTQDRVIPVDAAQEAERGLTARGAHVQVRVHPGLGHGVDGTVLEEARQFLRAVLPQH